MEAQRTFNLDYTSAQTQIFFEGSEKYKIVTKGRRFGATKGAAQAFIEWLLEGVSPLLWGDTINGNIDRYYERYFYPILKTLPVEIEWHWDRQKRQLKIGDSFCDFRSADRPENWEGFGYKKIFLNEAGIILEDDYLYNNAILPMMLDFPDSQLIAAGVPKGKIKKNGSEHKFYTLYKQAQQNINGSYKLYEYTTYDNPYLRREDIKELELEYQAQDYSAYEQEILGKFVDVIVGGNPFFLHFKEADHVSDKVEYIPGIAVYLSIDFNVDPITCVMGQIWNGGNSVQFFDELSINAGSIPLLIEALKDKQKEYPGFLRNVKITGDSLGKNKDISQKDLASHYIKLQRGLKLNTTNFQLPNNPKHKDSRIDCNQVLLNHPDLKIHKDKCPTLIRDLKILQVDQFGEIIKKNRNVVSQLADSGDCFRYFINTWLHKWNEQNAGKTKEEIKQSFDHKYGDLGRLQLEQSLPQEPPRNEKIIPVKQYVTPGQKYAEEQGRNSRLKK